jgi:hypothetical protein
MNREDFRGIRRGMATPTRNALRKALRAPGEQPDGEHSHRRIQMKAQVPEEKENEDLKTVQDFTEVYQQEKVEGLQKPIKESLANVKFELTRKENKLYWREFYKERKANTVDKYAKWSF